jgi:hypothetical protein
MDNKLIAERLKELRTENKLSHDRLSEALKNKYGVKVASQTLKNYEKPTTCDDYEEELKFNKHPSLTAIAGMRIEYLYMFSDFYSVSADYLLGRSGVRTTDAELTAVCEYTGLSEISVGVLHDIIENHKEYAEINLVINMLLADFYRVREDRQPILSSIAAFLSMGKSDNEVILGNGCVGMLKDSNTNKSNLQRDGYLVKKYSDLGNMYLVEIQNNLKDIKRKIDGEFK